MELQDMSRRTLLKGGSAAMAGLTVLRVAGPAHAFPGRPGQEEVLEWIDQPPDPPPGVSLPNQLDWEELDSWLTPADDFFVINHYDQPVISAADWRLDIGGLVARPRTLTLEDLKARRAPGGHLHAGVLGQHRPAVLHRRDRQREVGRDAAGAVLERAGVLDDGHRGRVLGRGRRRGDDPRQRHPRPGGTADAR